MAKKEMLTMMPHPDKVLIKVSQANWNSLFSKYVTTSAGKKVELFTDAQEEEGFEKRYTQNVSVGLVVAVGERVKNILKGDMAIIDYSVTGNEDAQVGFLGADRIVCVDAFTTYHTEDSPPQMNGRLAYAIGDVENLSKLLGVVRMGKVIARTPYVFLKHEEATKLSVSESGMMIEEVEEICIREVLAADKDSISKESSKVLIKESDLFSRKVDGKELSVIFEQDIMAVL